MIPRPNHLTLAVSTLALAIASAWTPVLAQETQPGASTRPSNDLHAHTDVDCAICHQCPEPTKTEPCLRTCPRPRPKELSTELLKQDVPEGVILLDMLSDDADAKDHFGPVPFDHTGHAKWAEIAGGCTVCHHYTPEGGRHPACRTCHEREFAHKDLNKPGLKGAYHRQCMGCHREWSHSTKCSVCHIPRLSNGKAPSAEHITKDDVMGLMHPPVEAPDKEVYETDYPKGSKSLVYFHHVRHTETYNFACAECHRGDSCVRCHEPGKKHTQQLRTLTEHHEACSVCHDTENNCSHCHRRPGQPEPEPFTHDQTGFVLKPYHAKLSCRDCHRKMPFKALDRNCSGCHDEWDPDEFDHAVTGQGLDEIHAEMDCEFCHGEMNFKQPPTCSECHDAEEISFPAKRPGPVSSSSGA